MSDDQPFLMPGVFGRKFIIFGIIVIALTTVGVVFFDNTDDESFNLMDINPIDTTTPAPYKARTPELIDSLSQEAK